MTSIFARPPWNQKACKSGGHTAYHLEFEEGDSENSE